MPVAGREAVFTLNRQEGLAMTNLAFKIARMFHGA
jgi:hypothetical protein